MKCYSLSHLSDHVLLHDLAALVAQDRTTTAALLAHLAEVDARKLYLPAAYPSMYAWCVGELKLSEDAAAKRIQAARVARRFPAIFPILADGRLHLSAVVLLAPHLSPDTADELLAAAASRSKPELERLIAERFPRPDLPTLLQSLAPCEIGEQHAPGHVHVTTSEHALEPVGAPGSVPALAPVHDHVSQHAPGRVDPAMSRGKLAPLSPGRFALQVTIAQDTHDKLHYAQSLLAHTLPHGDLAQVLDRALDALVAKLEQRRFAATARSCPSRGRRTEDSRYVPAAVRRAVWQRDGGQCTFVATRVIAARPVPGSSSTTSRRSRAAVRRACRRCACNAGRTTSSPPRGCLEPTSCATSVTKLGAGWPCHVMRSSRPSATARQPSSPAWTR